MGRSHAKSKALRAARRELAKTVGAEYEKKHRDACLERLRTSLAKGQPGASVAKLHSVLGGKSPSVNGGVGSELQNGRMKGVALHDPALDQTGPNAPQVDHPTSKGKRQAAGDDSADEAADEEVGSDMGKKSDAKEASQNTNKSKRSSVAAKIRRGNKKKKRGMFSF